MKVLPEKENTGNACLAKFAGKIFTQQKKRQLGTRKETEKTHVSHDYECRPATIC